MLLRYLITNLLSITLLANENLVESIRSVFSQIFSTNVLLSFFYKILAAAIILLIFYLVGRYLSIFLERFLLRVEEELRRRYSDISRYIVYAIGVLIAIAVLSPEPFTFSILLLLVGLGVIVAMSDVLRNWGAEFYVRTVKPFKIGDWIEISGREGRVVRIDSLGIVIESIDRTRIHVPNTVLTREIVINRTSPYGVIFRINIDFPSDVDEISVSQQLAKILDDIRPDLVEDPKITYRGIVNGRSVFEVTITLLNVRKLNRIFEQISRKVKETWPSSRVYM